METVTPDWQNKFTDMNRRNLYALNKGILTDCKFLVGNGDNKKLFPAHKLILALASPVFERMFYGEFAEKSDPIVVSDVQPDSFKLMLEYIYSDNLELYSLRTIFELYYLADKYMLADVRERCADYLYRFAHSFNVCHCYEFAEMFQLADVKERSMQIIINNTSEILGEPNFTEISMSTLMFILDQDRLNISSEMELFDALLRFANKRVLFGDSKGGNVEQKSTETIKDPFQDLICRVTDENQNNSTQNKENNGTPRRSAFIKEEVFKEAVKKIRFLTMTRKQFANGPAVSKLLTKEEILTFFLLISKSNSDKITVPNGFSNSEEERNIRSSFYIACTDFDSCPCHQLR